MTKKPKAKVKKVRSTDVFPEHFSCNSLNSAVDIGSFTLSMAQLQKVGMKTMRQLKRMEQGKDDPGIQ